MKKALSLALSLAMCLTFAACSGGTTEESDPSTKESVNTETQTETPIEEPESDLQSVKDKGSLVVGITYFEPMDYKVNGSEEWVGFDADMANAFADSLGVEAEFTEITWDYKVMELDAKNIDCVWNGMTLNDEVKAAMSTSVPYCLNAQVLVVPSEKAEKMKELTSLEGLNVAVEAGSAGEDAAQALGAATIPVQKQADALMEVAAGTSDAAVIDLLMAGAMIGEGTSYENLTYTMNLNTAQGLESEEYGVGFRKGSDLTEVFNQFWAEQVANGTVLEVATTYGVQESLILDEAK